LKSTSLQRILLLPFVLLVILLAATIGILSYHSSERAADEFSKRVVLDMITRIRQSTEAHLTESYLALNAVVPQIAKLPAGNVLLALPEDMRHMEERLWIATSFYPGHRSVYFGDEDGGFIGLSRLPGMVELRIREPGDPERKVYRMNGPLSKGDLLRSHRYDTTKQLWYTRAVDLMGETWSPVYTDINTMLPTLTLSKPVYRTDGKLKGVVATDLSLQNLKTFFKEVNVSENGVAFIVDRQGAVIASSSDESRTEGVASALNTPERADKQSVLLHQAYGEVRYLIDSRSNLDVPVIRPMENDGSTVHLAVAGLKNAPGLDWTIVVAVPRKDFMGNATRNLYQSLAIGFIAVIIALCAGLSVLRRVLLDIRKLTDAARKIERGEPVDALDISRRDELGQLAQSFIEMETGLRTDRLTGVLNRSSLITQIGLRQRNATPEMPLFFSLLFIDLDRFKAINDVYGHEAGDRILIETAKRMKNMLRSEDSVARFGGDEFVVYLHGVSSDAHVEPIIEKLLTAIGEPIRLSNGLFEYVSASIGSASYPVDDTDLEGLLKVADLRMFEIKKLSKYHRAA
jgi:diguanylate cyclase (GGDEF)-like protein